MSAIPESKLPSLIEDVDALEEVLTRPDERLIDSVSRLDGDVTILGVGGKMGPSLARLLRRALDAAGKTNRVVGVDRFPDVAIRDRLEEFGVETLPCDLLDRAALDELPVTPNMIFMVGMKFGSTGQESLTWAINSFLPGAAAQRFAGSRIVAFSSGNVYAFSPLNSGGSSETNTVGPIGEYAQSTLGRERVLSHWCGATGSPLTIIRLNYAVELRYGVLYDVGKSVHDGEPVDVTMGNLNCIWQGDANATVIRALEIADTPPTVLNLTGPEILSVRRVAEDFGEFLGAEPEFDGEEAPTALLSNAARCFQRFGYPSVSARQVIEWTAHWIKIGGANLGKPTHFQTRDGKF